MLVSLPEVLDRTTAREVYESVLAHRGSGDEPVVLDLSGVRHADTFGAAALLELHRNAREEGWTLTLANIPEDLKKFFAFLRVDSVAFEPESAKRVESLLERLGGWGIGVYRGAIQQASLQLDGLYYFFIGPFVGRGPRARHVVRQINAIGGGSVGIVTLICFLMGLIMALQAAYQLRQFGADIFVANLVGVAMTRELGPLMTAIVLAARSGSSMTAELGTMVVTEEIDALRVMAINPRRFLFAPRFVAMTIALPCLAILADIAGILGGFFVAIVALQIGPTHYWNQTIKAILLSDIGTGLIKSVVFASVISVVSCHKGLRLTGGPEEVGRATTRAVVLAIILIILSDFFFTTLFYLLD